MAQYVARYETGRFIPARSLISQGLELEAVWEPVKRFRMNGTLGLLDTKIKNGESIDPKPFSLEELGLLFGIVTQVSILSVFNPLSQHALHVEGAFASVGRAQAQRFST